jgi:hypothetical protein
MARFSNHDHFICWLGSYWGNFEIILSQSQARLQEGTGKKVQSPTTTTMPLFNDVHAFTRVRFREIQVLPLLGLRWTRPNWVSFRTDAVKCEAKNLTVRFLGKVSHARATKKEAPGVKPGASFFGG